MLYGLEMWEMTPHIRIILGRFHHSAAHRLTGRQTQRGRDGGWVYPPLEEGMAEAVLQEVETYASCRQNIVGFFIVTRPIMEMCLEAAQRLVSRVANQWREQDGLGLDLEGMRTVAWEAEHTQRDANTDGAEIETD